MNVRIHPDDEELYAAMQREAAQRWFATMAPEERARREKEWEAEEDARQLVRETFSWLLAEVGEYVWHWGNGTGGWIAMQLIAEAEHQGLPLEQRSFDLSLPPVGPSHREIYERDAYRCRHCGDWHDLTIDHIVPKFHGGTNDPSNLQVLCRSCNSRKGTKL